MDNQSSGKVLGSKNWYHFMLHKSFLIESLAYGFCTVLFQTEVGDIDTKPVKNEKQQSSSSFSENFKNQ